MTSKTLIIGFLLALASFESGVAAFDISSILPLLSQITAGTNGGPSYTDFVAQLFPQKIRSLSPPAQQYVGTVLKNLKGDFARFQSLSPAAKQSLQQQFPMAAQLLQSPGIQKIAGQLLQG
ncbi:hypothetical protein AAVH_09208 [Aphelenchoides avenae]|nr:hypothetical protein AAVH_09208 [Aphelenchus avenae]